MYKSVIVCLFTFLSVFSDAQNITTPSRYKDNVFAEVLLQKNISYANGVHPETKKKFYLFDLYEPKSDTALKRPLVIWLHGGGFKFGSKKANGIKLWSDEFAKKGYVCAALNYRLSKKNPLFNFLELKKSCYEAVQSVEEAVLFFKKNRELYRIDTNRIILAGNSAGAMIALQSVYSSYAQLAASAQLQVTGASLKYNPSGIAAIINFWGGMFDINWLQNARVPIFSAYGSRDKIVPANHKDTSLYGSIAIHERADQLKIPNNIKAYEGYSHELQKHFNPLFTPGARTRRRWLDAGQSAADFLYMQLFQR